MRLNKVCAAGCALFILVLLVTAATGQTPEPAATATSVTPPPPTTTTAPATPNSTATSVTTGVPTPLPTPTATPNASIVVTDAPIGNNTNQTTAPEAVRPITQDSASTWVLVVCITLGFFVSGGACYVTLMWQQKALRIYSERFEQLLKAKAKDKKELENQFVERDREHEQQGGRAGGVGDAPGDDGDDGGEVLDEEARAARRRWLSMTEEEREQAKLDAYGDPDVLRANARKVAAEKRDRERKIEEQRRKMLRMRSADDDDENEDDGDEKRKKKAEEAEDDEAIDESHLPPLARRAARLQAEELRRGPMMVRRSAMLSNPELSPFRPFDSPMSGATLSPSSGGALNVPQKDVMTSALQQSLLVHQNLTKLKRSSQLRHIEGLI